VHIGRDALQVTNRSDQAWVCWLRVGPGSLVYAPAVEITSGGSRELPFAEFKDGTAHLDPTALNRLARRIIDARCRDEAGRFHTVRMPQRFY
jgi:hypothetical protein